MVRGSWIEVGSGQWAVTSRQLVERNISEQEVREAGATAELIEDYPDDKYAPSALLLGFSAAGRRPALSSIVRRL